MFIAVLFRSVPNWAQSYQSWWCTAEAFPFVGLKMCLKNLQMKCPPSRKMMPSGSSKTRVQLASILDRKSRTFCDAAADSTVNISSLQCIIIACGLLSFHMQGSFLWDTTADSWAGSTPLASASNHPTMILRKCGTAAARWVSTRKLPARMLFWRQQTEAFHLKNVTWPVGATEIVYWLAFLQSAATPEHIEVTAFTDSLMLQRSPPARLCYWLHTLCCAVALNFQTPGEQMDLNQGRFLSNGRCGYILKPSFLCSPTSNFNPENTGGGPGHVPTQLTIRVSGILKRVES